MPRKSKRRILIIDDQDAIHEDYRKIICPKQARSESLDAVEAELFGGTAEAPEGWDQYEIDSAYQGREAVDLVERSLHEGRPYSVAFVDIRMPPGWDGIETVQQIWKIDPEVLIVLCSAHCDYSWRDIVEQLGRTDRFLILKKPFDNMEVRQCAAALAERWLVARTDALTGILNRRAFEEHLRRDWAQSLRHEQPLTCVMFDVDFFKRVNDTYGHTVGDQTLIAITQMLQQHIPPGSSLCRFGGDELCVLMPGTDEANAAVWADHLRKRLADEAVRAGDEKIRVTVSCGVAGLSAATVRQDALIEHADAALRGAKQAGRNRVYCWSDDGQPEDHLQRIQQYAARFKGLTASDMMSRSVGSVDQSSTVGEAALLFLKGGLSAAPVINASGELVGMLSDKDIMEAWGDDDGWSRRVDQVMMPGIIQYEPTAPADEIFKFLCRVQLRWVVVTEQLHPVGVVTCSSFLEWFCGAYGEPQLAHCHAD